MSQDDLPAVLMRALMKLGRRMRRAPRPEGASLSGIAILGALHRLGPMPAARLAEEQRLAPQSLSRLIADLEKRGLISRAEGRTDRRTLVLSITQRGSKLLSEDMRARRAWLTQALQTLSADERAALRAAAPLMERLAAWESDEEILGI